MHTHRSRYHNKRTRSLPVCHCVCCFHTRHITRRREHHSNPLRRSASLLARPVSRTHHRRGTQFCLHCCVPATRWHDVQSLHACHAVGLLTRWNTHHLLLLHAACRTGSAWRHTDGLQPLRRQSLSLHVALHCRINSTCRCRLLLLLTLLSAVAARCVSRARLSVTHVACVTRIPPPPSRRKPGRRKGLGGREQRGYAAVATAESPPEQSAPKDPTWCRKSSAAANWSTPAQSR